MAHDLESDTELAYREADIPVALIVPTWRSIHELRNGLTASTLISTKGGACESCKRENEARKTVDALSARVGEYLRKRRVRARPTPITWNRDRSGESLYPRIQETLHAQARRLARLGFRQAAMKPWLFYLQVSNIGNLFVGFNGDDLEPVWSDPTPQVWFLPLGGVRHALLESECAAAAEAYLREQGFALRGDKYLPPITDDEPEPSPVDMGSCTRLPHSERRELRREEAAERLDLA